MTAPDGLLRDAGGARPTSDVDALIARLKRDAQEWEDTLGDDSRTAALEREAAAALVQLREEHAMSFDIHRYAAAAVMGERGLVPPEPTLPIRTDRCGVCAGLGAVDNPA